MAVLKKLIMLYIDAFYVVYQEKQDICPTF